MQMRALKFLGSILAGAVLLFVFVINFSAVQSRFECSGEFWPRRGNFEWVDEKQPLTIYMQLDEYRWWVGLWNDSDGSLWVEIPNELPLYFGHIDEVVTRLDIYDSDKLTTFRGEFSKLSRFISLRTPEGSFKGACKPLQ